MCIAIPAKVMAVEGPYATVESKGNRFRVQIGLVRAQVDDYVLVHAGCAIEIMNKKEAEDLAQLFEAIEEVSYE